MDLVVFHELRQPRGADRCANHSCAHLCLAAPSISAGSPQHSCLCADGYQLTEDRVNCKLMPKPSSTTRHPYGPGHEADGDHEGEHVAEDGGRIAGIIIAALSLLALIVAIVRIEY